MLTKLEDLEDAFRHYDVLRARLAKDVSILVEELAKTERRNLARMKSTCSGIDGLTREYAVYMTQLNGLRIKHEQMAASQESLLQVKREWGVLTARTNLFQSELRRWHEVRDLVYEQIKWRRRKLYVEESRLPPQTLSQNLASDDVFHLIHAVLNPHAQSDEAVENACFPDIGLSNSDFHAHMHAVLRVLLAQRRQRPVRFLDVGCGAGLKVFSALRYVDDAAGFDFDPAYVQAGKKFFDAQANSNASVFQHDALQFDDYDQFDVIYFYRPINDESLLAEMERRISDRARPGTILVAPYVGFSHRHASHGCGRVDGAIYLSQTPQKKADYWRRKAERIGHFILKEDESPLRSIWSPIFDVSRSNGYDSPARYKKPRY